MMEKKEDYQMILKIVFVGDAQVGKTSLYTRETDNVFNKQWICTIGVDFKIKTYKVGNINAKVQYWDTAGQERFRSIQRPYYKNTHAILLCFSLADRKSFQNLHHWINEIKNYGVDGKIYLIGCKSDLNAEVYTDEILVFAEQHNLLYFQTSAKESQGVQQCFSSIVTQTTQRQIQKMAFEGKQTKKQVGLAQKVPPQKKTCC